MGRLQQRPCFAWACQSPGGFKGDPGRGGAWLGNGDRCIAVIDSVIANLEVYDEGRLNQVLLDRQVDNVVALVIKRYSERDPYSRIIADFNGNGEEKTQEEMKFIPMMDKVENIRQIIDRFSIFAETNRDLGSTKFAVLKDSLADGDEAKWEIFLRMYGRGKVTAEGFLPPPSVHKLQVQNRTFFMFWFNI